MKPTFACKLDDIPDGGAVRVDADPPVALFRVGETVYATADSCTHEEWSLGEEGEVEGFEVTCSLHLASFDIRTGRPLCLPATRALQTFTAVVEDGDVYLGAPSEPADAPPPAVRNQSLLSRTVAGDCGHRNRLLFSGEDASERREPMTNWGRWGERTRASGGNP